MIDGRRRRGSAEKKLECFFVGIDVRKVVVGGKRRGNGVEEVG